MILDIEIYNSSCGPRSFRLELKRKFLFAFIKKNPTLKSSENETIIEYKFKQIMNEYMGTETHQTVEERLFLEYLICSKTFKKEVYRTNEERYSLKILIGSSDTVHPFIQPIEIQHNSPKRNKKKDILNIQFITKKLSKMKNLFSTVFGQFAKKNNDDILIEKGMPKPISGINYKDLLKIKVAFEKMDVNDSFHVRNELAYPVRKIANEHFPEYKVSVRRIGDSYRAYRVA